MSEASHTVAYVEPPEVEARNLWVGVRLQAGAIAFFFLGFVFAYFYLRSLNTAHMWKPKHVGASIGLGTAIAVCLLLSAALVWNAARQLRAGRRAAWRGSGALALALGVAACVLQIVQWTNMGFGPADGGYASVFIGWTGFQLVVVLMTMIWLEMLLAVGLRHRRTDGEAGLVLPGLEAFRFFWAFIAASGFAAYVVLYLA